MKRFRVDLHKENKGKKSNGTYKSETSHPLRGRPPHCTRHPDRRLDVYCTSCQQPCCQRCVKLDHASDSHKTSDLASQALLLAPQLKELILQVEWHAGVLQDLVEVCNDSRAVAHDAMEGMMRRIKINADTLPPGSQRSETVTLKKTASLAKLHATQSSSSKDCLDNVISTVTDCRRRLLSINQYGSPYDILTECPKLQKELAEVCKQEVMVSLWQCLVAPPPDPTRHGIVLHKLTHAQAGQVNSDKPVTSCLEYSFQIPVYHGVAGLALHAGHIWLVGYRVDTLAIYTTAGLVKCVLVIEQIRRPQGLVVFTAHEPSPDTGDSNGLCTRVVITDHGRRCLHWLAFRMSGDQWEMTAHSAQTLGYRPAGISVCAASQQLLVCDPHNSALHLYRHNDGHHVTSLSLADTTIKPYSALAVPAGLPHAFLVRDWQQCALFWVAPDGTVVSFYDGMDREKPHTKFHPADVVLDQRGRLLTADLVGHTLELFRPEDGKYMGIGQHISKEEKLLRPHRLHVDEASGKLVLAHQPFDRVQLLVLNYKLLIGSMWPHNLNKHTVTLD